MFNRRNFIILTVLAVVVLILLIALPAFDVPIPKDIRPQLITFVSAAFTFFIGVLIPQAK